MVDDKHHQSVVVNMNDDEEETTVWSWQRVKPKPKSLKRPNQVSPILLKKKIALDSAPSTSYNQFAILSESTPNNGNEDETEELDMITEDTLDESAKPPPIFLSEVSDIKGMLAYLETKIKKELFFYKVQRDGHVRVMVKTIEEYRKLVKTLNTDFVKFHTYQLKHERAFRVVIKNLHFSTDIDLIKQDVESKGHAVRNISNIKSRVTKEPLNLFYLDIEPNNKNLDIYKVKHIGNAVVNIEPPRKTKEIVQCYRCQEFGHTKSYCAKSHRCVKCSFNHPSNICPKDKEQPAKCANCNEDHAASYKGCKVYQELITKKLVSGRNHLKNTKDDNNKNDPATSQSFAPFNNFSQEPKDYQSYAQVAAGNSISNTSLERIEQLLEKQFQLTNNLLNMIMLLVNKLCK